MLHKPTLLAFRSAIEAASGVGRGTYVVPDCRCSVGLLGAALGFDFDTKRDADIAELLATDFDLDERTCRYIEACTEAWAPSRYNGMIKFDIPSFKSHEDEPFDFCAKNSPTAKALRKIRVLRLIDDQLALCEEHEAIKPAVIVKELVPC